jgi:hypothetical protein
MKLSNLFAAAAIVLFAGCGTPYRATDTTIVVAPDGTQRAFITQYPTASNAVWMHYDPALVGPVDWEFAGWTPMDEADYTVRFNMDNEDYYAWYDENGNWIGTAYVMKDYYHTLPNAVTTTVNNQFPGYTITAVNKQIQKDRLVYEVELKNSDTKVKLQLDGSGNIIKQRSKSLY